MRLPNLLEHESLNEVIEQSDAWISLLRLHCHPDTKLLLCTLFAPICFNNIDKPIYPCQSLCNVVQKGCEERMRQYGFPWPEMLRCDKFPSDHDMCIKPLEVSNPKSSNMCKSCSQVVTLENILDNYCRSAVVLKARLRSHNDSHVVIGKSKPFKLPHHAGKKNSFVGKAVRLHTDDEDPSCRCNITKGNHLVMAVVGRRELTAQLILPWTQDKNFKAAIRRLKKVNCTTLGREIRESVMRQTIKRMVPVRTAASRPARRKDT
ncbi:sfrp2 [Aphelenchoides avenae]|nr:sfrp2 [Aphelenchus avenae]